MALADYGRALVTGASSGIGEAIARALAARGVAVTALARRRDWLEALAGETGAEALPLDLNDRDALYAALADRPFDILVNNAGLGRSMASLIEAEPDDIDLTIDTNVTAALHVVRAVAPGMLARDRGHIVNIGSLAGLYPLGAALYGATKGAVHLLSQNLRLQLLGSRVRVTEICPGRVATDFFRAAWGSEEKVRELLGAFNPLRPDDIAQAMLYAVDAPWHVNVSTIELAPTEQAPGGINTGRVRERQI